MKKLINKRYLEITNIKAFIVTLIKSKLVWVIISIGILIHIIAYFIINDWTLGLLLFPYNLLLTICYYGLPLSLIIIIGYSFFKNKYNLLSTYIIKIYTGIFIVYIISVFVIPSNPNRVLKAVNFAKEGNIVVTALYQFKADSGVFPQSINQLYPKYIIMPTDTFNKLGWKYFRFNKNESNQYSAFRFMKLYPFPHTKVYYTDDNFMKGWYIDCEGDKTELNINK